MRFKKVVVLIALLFAIACLLVGYGFMKSQKTVRSEIFIPYILSSNPDPFNIVWSGDWTVCNHGWNGLIDYSKDGQILGAYAEAWAHSTDLLRWTFRLKPNLKWSNGSEMRPDQIVESLKASALGTAHSNFSTAIEEISASPNREIVFRLKKPVPGFLITLSYIDWAIIHPSTFEIDGEKIKLIEMTPCSGHFCAKKPISDAPTVSRIEVTRNDYHPNKLINPIPNGAIISYTDCEELLAHKDRVISFRSYAEMITPRCAQELQQAGFSISRTDPTWILKGDFTDRGRSRIAKEQRIKLFVELQKALRKGPIDFGVSRVTGIRPPLTDGAVELKEFESLVDVLDADTAKIKLSIPSISVVTMEQWSHWKTFQWLIAAIQTAGIKVETHLLTRSEFSQAMGQDKLQKNYDLVFLPLGSGDPDPDANWQIARHFFYKTLVTEGQLSDAFFEGDRNKRADLYKKLAIGLLKEGVMLPLMTDADWVGIHESAKTTIAPTFRQGLTFYDLVF